MASDAAGTAPAIADELPAVEGKVCSFRFRPAVVEALQAIPKETRRDWLEELILAAVYGGDAADRMEIALADATIAQCEAKKREVQARLAARDTYAARKDQLIDAVLLRLHNIGPINEGTRKGWDLWFKARGIPPATYARALEQFNAEKDS